MPSWRHFVRQPIDDTFQFNVLIAVYLMVRCIARVNALTDSLDLAFQASYVWDLTGSFITRHHSVLSASTGRPCDVDSRTHGQLLLWQRTSRQFTTVCKSQRVVQLRVYAVLLELSIECFAIEAEDAGCECFVVAYGFDDVQNIAAFDFLHAN